MNSMKVKVIEGADILASCTKYIAHQVNCKSTGSKGLSQAMFKKYPYSNVYTDGTVRIPGHIIVRGDGEDTRYVINMVAQFYPGKPTLSPFDSPETRLKWFKTCLDEILEIKDLESIAFPYKIGCGLAGGDWSEYLKLIEDFAQKTEAEVYICKL